jgi:hypothetical protein
MAQPTNNALQAVDPVLTNMLLAYSQADNRFVADRVFPSVPVDFITSTYYLLTQKYWFADEAKVRAPGGPVARGGYGVETDTVTSLQYALGHIIPDENRANNQVPMSLERMGAEWLAGQHLINRERRFAAAAMITGVWGTSNSSATKWSDYAASDPIAAIKTAKRTISQATGMTPNQMVMGEIVADALENHPDLIDRIKYTQLATSTSVRAAMAALFELEFLVGKAIYNSANEGATASYAAIIDDDCLVCYTKPGADMMTASAGKTFYWAPGGGMGTAEPIWHDNQIKSDVLDSKQQNAHKITASNLGYIFLDIVD